MKSIFFKLGFCLSVLLFASCSNSNDDVLNETRDDSRTFLGSSNPTVLDTISVDVVKQLYTGILAATNATPQEISAALSKIKYDVVISKVEYKAIDPFRTRKTLSGLFAYPVLPKADRNKKLSVVSIQHGTLAVPTQAPSRILDRALVARDGLGLISAANENGYLSVQADYFGYGTDENNLHYYEHAASLAEATRELIESVPSYALRQRLRVDYNKLYLFGYSEGGGATIATLKSFSEKRFLFRDYVTVAGAGAYDKPASVDYIIQQTTGDSPQFSASYAWVVLTYNKVYNINRPLDQLYTPAVAPEMAKYVDNNAIMTSQAIPSAPSEVFNQQFTANVLAGKDKQFIAAFKANDISDFKAKGSLDFVYGTNDTWVPPFNTINLAANLNKRGIPSTVTAFQNGTHASTYPVFAVIAAKKLN